MRQFRLTISLLLLLTVVSLFIFSFENNDELSSDSDIHFFYAQGCKHCEAQKGFNDYLQERYSVDIAYHDASKSSDFLVQELSSRGYPIANLAVPMTIVGDDVFRGFSDDTAAAIEAKVQGNDPVPAQRGKLELPIFGDVDVRQYSLPTLAVLLGLADGFNPCALWVLAFLIGLLMGTCDKRKIWLVVGTFVTASAILYFLFMTAWLNIFLWVGYVRPILIAVGLIGIFAGASHIREFIKRGPMVCEVTASSTRESLMEGARRIVSAPVTLATFFGIVILAFAVNMIEFVCSSFLPVVFTQTLALQPLSALQYYAYIVLYVFFFMLLEFIIFAAAIFAVSFTPEKYAKWFQLIGGVVMLFLGLVLLLFPHLLR